MRKKTFLLVLITFAICMITNGQTKISSQDAFDIFENNCEITLIDVRTEKEFQAGHIKDAVNINWQNQEVFDKLISTIPKENKLYIYCKSGGRSAKAATRLTELGYVVYEIEGGITKWNENELPLITPPTDPGKSEIESVDN